MDSYLTPHSPITQCMNGRRQYARARDGLREGGRAEEGSERRRDVAIREREERVRERGREGAKEVARVQGRLQWRSPEEEASVYVLDPRQ